MEKKNKLQNPYVGLSEEERWEKYELQGSFLVTYRQCVCS